MNVMRLKEKAVEIAKCVLPYGAINRTQRRAADTTQLYQAIPPKIYNQNHEQMHLFYLQDDLCKMQPYSFVAGVYPQHIFWDRFNQTLDTHFYTHDQICNLSKFVPQKRFAQYVESEAILPETFRTLDLKRGLAEEFTAIFTHSERQLDLYPNAKFSPGGGVWYGNDSSAGGELDPLRYMKKAKMVSIVSSAKTMCPLHKYRIELAKHLRNNQLADTFGNFDGGNGVPICMSLDEYRFSIIIENYISAYYFTEKLLNCFAAMTIPVYIGATQIGQFFNMDGIVCLKSTSSFHEIEETLKNCTKEFYSERISAVQDNYERAKSYRSIEDWLYKNYTSLLID